MTQLGRPGGSHDAVSTAQDRWQEMFWTETPVRARAAQAEQAELWPEAAAAPRRAAQARRAAAPVARVATSAAAARPLARKALRTPTAGVAYADRGRRVRTEDIARYLQVNGAVYGRLSPVQALSLPRRSFIAELQLWKGSELGTPFVTGC